MKPFFIITFLLISTFCFSQKQYDFDYLIEYELTTYKDSVEKTIKIFYLTNSRRNNYLAVVTELDSLNYIMDFKDENGLAFNVNLLKSDLNKAEFINIDCDYVRNYHNRFKFRIKEYDFLNIKDTIINGTEYNRYKLTSIKPRKKERKKEKNLQLNSILLKSKLNSTYLYFIFLLPMKNGKAKKTFPMEFLRKGI